MFAKLGTPDHLYVDGHWWKVIERRGGWVRLYRRHWFTKHYKNVRTTEGF